MSLGLRRPGSEECSEDAAERDDASDEFSQLTQCSAIRYAHYIALCTIAYALAAARIGGQSPARVLPAQAGQGHAALGSLTGLAKLSRHRTEPRHGPTGEEGRQIHLAHDVGDCAALEASVTDDFCKVRDRGRGEVDVRRGCRA
jgi:hypothetical protein